MDVCEQRLESILCYTTAISVISECAYFIKNFQFIMAFIIIKNSIG